MISRAEKSHRSPRAESRGLAHFSQEAASGLRAFSPLDVARGERWLFYLAAIIFASCAEPTEPEVLDRTGVVSGPITTTGSGDAWVFLYRPGEGPPGAPAEPRAVTAVSARRLQSDPRYVIAHVKPNAYRLFGSK